MDNPEKNRQDSTGVVTVTNQNISEFLMVACEKDVCLKFKAKGISMAPFICHGDLLVIEPVSKKKVEAGQIAAGIKAINNHLIVHRIIETGKMYLLKGDNNYHTDGYYKKKEIYGIVKDIVPQTHLNGWRKKSRQMFLRLNYFNRTNAFFSRIGVLTPACRLFNKILF